MFSTLSGALHAAPDAVYEYPADDMLLPLSIRSRPLHFWLGRCFVDIADMGIRNFIVPAFVLAVEEDPDKSQEKRDRRYPIPEIANKRPASRYAPSILADDAQA